MKQTTAFVDKWSLDGTKAKLLLSGLPPSRRRFVCASGGKRAPPFSVGRLFAARVNVHVLRDMMICDEVSESHVLFELRRVCDRF